MTAPIVTTEELSECPVCAEAEKVVPLVRTGTHDKICNTCGFACTLQTAEDEADAEADRLVRSRGWNEAKGRGRHIGRYGTRW